jgi:hypothetical protein
MIKEKPAWNLNLSKQHGSLIAVDKGEFFVDFNPKIAEGVFFSNYHAFFCEMARIPSIILVNQTLQVTTHVVFTLPAQT